MKSVHYKEQTLEVLGWYCPEIHGENIPTPNMELSDKEWQTAIDNNANKVNLDIGGVYYYEEPETLEHQIKRVYQIKLNEIHNNADALVSDLEDKYSEIEKSTFTKQRAESEDWQADNQAKTPCLDQLATTRGIDRLVFIQKVIDAITEADEQSFAVVAVQQAKEDELNAAKVLGLDALNAVDTTLILGA